MHGYISRVQMGEKYDPLWDVCMYIILNGLQNLQMDAYTQSQLHPMTQMPEPMWTHTQKPQRKQSVVYARKTVGPLTGEPVKCVQIIGCTCHVWECASCQPPSGQYLQKKKNQLSVSPTCHNKILVITCVIVTNFYLTTNDTLEQEMLECSLHLTVWCPNAKSHVY